MEPQCLGPYLYSCVRKLYFFFSLSHFLPLRLVVGVELGDGRHSMAEHYVGVVKGLLHLHSTVGTPANVVICWRRGRESVSVNVSMATESPGPFFSVPTWLQWVLNVKHRGPVAVHQVLLNLIFGHVATAVFYPDASLQIVEVAAVQLKELDEQNSNVTVGAADVVPIVELQGGRSLLAADVYTDLSPHRKSFPIKT